MSFNAPGDGTVHGGFELSADQALRQLRDIRDTGGEADAALQRLGTTMDGLGGETSTRRLRSYKSVLSDVGTTAENTAGRVSSSWATQTRVIDSEAGKIERRLGLLEERFRRYGSIDASANVSLAGFDRVNAQLSELEARLDRLDARSVRSRVAVGGGFSNAAGGGFGGGGGQGLVAGDGRSGLFSSLGGIPGRLPWWAAAVPFAPQLLGGAGALVGSAGAGVLGASAVGMAGVSTLAAGGGLTMAIAKPALAAMGQLTKAQEAYNKAVAEFGKSSSQAATAQRNLNYALTQNPMAAGASRQLTLARSEWRSATAPARQAFYTGVSGVLYNARRAIPNVARAATTATTATAGAATAYSGFLAQQPQQQFLDRLVAQFSTDLPIVEHSLQNVTTIFEHLTTAALPFFHEAVVWVDHWTAGMARSTSNTGKVNAEMQTLVTSAKDWAKLTGAAARDIRDLFSPGVQPGNSMVVGLTHTLDRWDVWLQRNPGKVRQFFRDGVNGTERIAGVIGHLASDVWGIFRALNPILTRAEDFLRFASGLGGGNLLAGGALLYGAYGGARGALGGRGPSAAGLAGSFILGGAGGVGRAGVTGGRFGGGAAVGAAQADAALARQVYPGAGYLLPPTGFGRAGAPASALGEQLPLFAGLGAGAYAYRTAAASTVLARGERAFRATYGGYAPETRYALPTSEIGVVPMAERGGITGLAARAGGALRGAAAGAARIILPLAAIQGIIATAQGGGALPTRVNRGISTVASTLTLGAVSPAGFEHLLGSAFGAQNAGGSLGSTQTRAAMASISAQANAVRTPTQMQAVINRVRFAPSRFEMSPGDRAKLEGFLRQAEATAVTNAGAYASNTFESAFQRGLMNPGHSPAWAVRTALSGIPEQLRGLGPQGSRAFARDTAQWVAQMETDNPRLRRPLDRLMAGIIDQMNTLQGHVHGKMRDIRDSVFFFNGQILTGSQTTWQAIGKALTDPSQVALEKLTGIWGEINTQAITALSQMGFSKGEAQQIVTMTAKGGQQAAGAAAVVGIQTSLGSNVHLTSRHPKHERGGVIGGAGLLDTVPTPDGGLAAPGEAYIANRHTMMDLSSATLAKFGKTAWQMIRDEHRAHSAPVTQGPMNYNRHARGGRYLRGGGFGGIAGTATTLGTRGGGSATGPYVYPFPGLSPGRTDQGYDLSGAGPLFALGSGTVVHSGLWPGWPGTGGVVYRLDSGPDAGANVYYMEHVQSNVSVGQHVGAGQQIATLLSGYPYLEAGWANAAGTAPLTPYNGAADGTPMSGGVNFRSFVNALLSGGRLPAGMGAGVAGTPTRQISLRAPRSGLRGIPGAMADQASRLYAAGLQSQINRRIGGMGGSGAGVTVLGPGGGATVGASVFGGPGDPGTGSTGYRGDNLYQHPDSYAELGMGTALGGLPYMTPLRVTHGGQSEIVYKRDIGLGGGPVGNVPRDIDLWFQAASAIGVSGLAPVQVQRMRERGGRVNWAGWNAKGGDFITNGPTLFGAGEGGKRERVSISPLGRDGRVIHVNIDRVEWHATNTAQLDATAEYVAGRILDALNEGHTSDAELAGAAT